ncbi:MAG: thioredoxin family protein [Candidatus Methylomirabilis sp.]|nr:thioredoxin family protein [Deltaproteobacteria bacterium]
MADRLSIGAAAPDFSLKGVDGKTHRLADYADFPVLVVMFTCNHCPYVQAYEDRLIALQADYEAKGARFVAINANETANHPEDSFDKMVERARRLGFNFPYLRDEDQSVATAYGAACTPEVFVFDRERRLRYTGRIDDNHRDASKVTKRELRDALDALLAGKAPPAAETHPIGCSIKWST